MTCNLSVCPHDTAKNLPGWFFMNTYLQHHADMHIHLELYDDFATQRQAVLDGSIQLTYANPYDAAIFARELGFVPLARRCNSSDEVYIVTSADSALTSLSDTSGASLRLASATDKTAVHNLAVGLLKEAGANRDDFELDLKGNYIAVIKAVTKGEADLGIVFSETFDGLSGIAKEQLKVLGSSHEGKTFHLFCASPDLGEKIADLAAVLTSMHNQEDGRKCLKDLGFDGFEAIDAAAFEDLVEACGTDW